MARRLGIFGGTFDPPHTGHFIVAAEAAEVLQLDTVLLIPSGAPAHRPQRPGASPEQRLRMVQAGVADDRRFEVRDLEVQREGPTYTIDTLRELRQREPDAELVLLLGIDQFRKFSTWREPDRVAELATLAVLSRDGETADTSGAYGPLSVPVTRIDISGTLVRRRVAERKSIRFYVPDAVRNIIEVEKLYMGSE